MLVDVEVPVQGLTVTEATLVRWLRAVGERVEKGEPLFEIETDKAVTEVECPASGTLLAQLAGEGETVKLGSAVGQVGTEAGDRAETLTTRPPLPASGGTLTPQPPLPASGEGESAAAQVPLPRAGEGRVRADTANMPPLVSPRARRAAEQLGIDLARVTPTGGRGRHIRERDVLAAAEGVASRESQGASPATTPPLLTPHASRLTPLPPIKRITAERTAASFRDTPHFYLTREVSAERLVTLREDMVAGAACIGGVRITITDLLIKALALSLRAHPEFNAQWAGGQIVSLPTVDVGIATDTPGGLLVPVLREADTLPLAQISARRADLVERARAGKARPEELTGGSFTLSNLGQLDVDQFEAIINPPQSGILSVGAIKRRPFVVDDQLAACRTLFMTLSVDHRVVDGAQAARLMQRLAQLVERPVLICAQ